jgi:hypothetical protein
MNTESFKSLFLALRELHGENPIINNNISFGLANNY